MEGKKSLSRAKSEFVDVLLQSVSDMPREEAEQRISGIVSDVWNYCESQVRRMPTRPKKEP